MPSFNKVILVGNLTKDPELRYTPSGTPVGNLDLAINRTHTTQGGEQRDEVCFIGIVLWGKTAENCQQYLSKGRPVLVEGYLQQQTWEDRTSGQKRSKHQVVAERVQFLGGKPSDTGPSKSEPQAAGKPEDEVPF